MQQSSASAAASLKRKMDPPVRGPAAKLGEKQKRKKAKKDKNRKRKSVMDKASDADGVDKDSIDLEMVGSEDERDEEGVAVDGEQSHLTNTRFDKFDVSPNTIKALHTILKYETMTQVQEATFPVILRGQDCLAKARTGTGKTIAFLLPAIESILKETGRQSRNPIYVLVVCPTRELAQQAAKEAQVLLTFHTGLGAQVVYGGKPMHSEQMNLSRNPCQILTGTPGRLVDHIQNTPELAKQLKSVKLFVLDEADRMLDMGFRESLHKIMQALPAEKQTLLFSATVPSEVHNITKVALKDDYVFIDTVGKDSQDTHAKVKQQYIVVPLEQQLTVVHESLREHMASDTQFKIIVFCTTARVTAFMAKLFSNLGFNSREIHSRINQRNRTRVSDEFRHSKGGIILFTSDVSARGVDYPNVSLVVQVGAASDLEQYIHRLGRTGRAGKTGEGLLILAPWENYFLKKLESTKVSITPVHSPEFSSQGNMKILAAAARMDPKIKEMAYQAWLGYYRSVKGMALDKKKLVEYANQFSFSMGLAEPPALEKKLLLKMNLFGVPGIRVY